MAELKKSNFCFVLFVLRALQVTVGSLESYDGNCNVIDLCVKLSLLSNSIFSVFYVSRIVKIGGVHLRLLGTNGFHVKIKNGRFTAASIAALSSTSNMKVSCRRLADNVKTLHQKACRTCTTIIFLYSTNYSLICGIVVDVAVVKS